MWCIDYRVVSGLACILVSAKYQLRSPGIDLRGGGGRTGDWGLRRVKTKEVPVLSGDNTKPTVVCCLLVQILNQRTFSSNSDIRDPDFLIYSFIQSFKILKILRKFVMKFKKIFVSTFHGNFERQFPVEVWLPHSPLAIFFLHP